MEYHVAQDVGGFFQMDVHGFGIKAGAFLGREGVELRADAVHFRGDGLRGALFRPLEEHMLDIVGHTASPGRSLTEPVPTHTPMETERK